MGEGQVAPISIAFLVAAALVLRKGAERAAAMMAAAAMIEPHIALPVCLAMFVARPKTRLVLLACALVLGTVSVFALGLQQNIEYVQRVLPAQIAVESDFSDQYSLTSLAMTLGLSKGPSVALGQGSYILLVSLAVLLAYRYSGRRQGDPELLIFLPMALSVVGGPYVHIEHLLAVIPLAAATVVRHSSALWSWGLAFVIACPVRLGLKLLGKVHVAYMHLPPLSLDKQQTLAETPWAVSIAGQHGTLSDVLTKVPTWMGAIVLITIAIVNYKGLNREGARYLAFTGSQAVEENKASA